jgi:hypothetical protein
MEDAGLPVAVGQIEVTTSPRPSEESYHRGGSALRSDESTTAYGLRMRHWCTGPETAYNAVELGDCHSA